ncbi:MAG: hypothetical protein JXR37_35550 [Kiritimatiellae bacterium]|nr:hypothetical protein [Kiritimatiellia bacterium]
MRFLRCLCVVSALLAGGCLKIDHDLTLRADGSGELRLSYGMAQERLDSLAVMRVLDRLTPAPAAGEEAEAWPPVLQVFHDTEEQIRAQFEAREAPGVVVEEITRRTRDTWQYVVVKLRFSDVRELNALPCLAGNGIALQRNGNGDWALTFAYGGARVELPEDGSDPDPRKLAMALIAGFRLETRITVPGRIVETDAGKTNGQTAVWIFDHDADFAALKDLPTRTFRLVFEGRDVTLSPRTGE